MFINLNELNTKKVLSIDELVLKDDNLDKRIHDLINAKVIGKIYLDSVDNIILNCEFSGTMLIEDSISLEDVPYDFNIKIEEKVNEIEENYQDCYSFSKNTLDLKSILWQNIVLEVPISYTKVNDANLKGNGWELLNEVEKTEIDPRLKKLEDLLKGDD